MIRISFLILILVLFSFATFAQIQEKSQTVKISQFGRLTECGVTGQIDSLLISLNENLDSKGYIIIYHEDNFISKQQRQFTDRIIKRHISLRKFDKDRIRIIDGGSNKNLLTELWLIPKNANLPKAYKFFDYLKMNDKSLQEKFRQTFINLVNETGHNQLYIINYGKKSEIALAKTQQNRVIRTSFDFDYSRVIYIDKENSLRQKAEFWIVPDGAQPPQINK